MTNERLDILEEARRLTTQDRNATYGSFVDNLILHGALCRLYLEGGGHKYSDAHNASMFQVFAKIARMANGVFHKDNYVDAVNYIGAAFEAETCALALTVDGESRPEIEETPFMKQLNARFDAACERYAPKLKNVVEVNSPDIVDPHRDSKRCPECDGVIGESTAYHKPGCDTWGWPLCSAKKYGWCSKCLHPQPAKGAKHTRSCPESARNRPV